MTDAELIRRAVARDDRAAFGELVRRHQSSVRRFLQHLSGDAALADDLAQDTFVQAWRSLQRFESRASFSCWLLGIAHNHWRNARRRQRDRTPLEAAHLAALEPVPSPAVASDLRQDLTRALATLAPDEQTALHLCYQQGLSHAEIANALQWPLGTVKTHINRAREKLRPQLASWNPQV